jgi:hypothetical protein
MTTDTLEARIAARPAPKITQAIVDDNITSVDYLLSGVTTIAVATLYNGYTVVGVAACAYPENFDAEIGKELALRDAKRQVWPVLGFRLADQRYGSTDR